MRILIVGASGLIGSYLFRAAQSAGHSVLGTFCKLPLPGLIHFDAADVGAAQGLLDTYRPDAVVYAAGWTWVDGCQGDPERAMDENARQPERLAGMCTQANIHFTYFSTSYVFDGTKGPYREEDAPNPINAYSRSKWAGEQMVQSVSDGAALIPRVVAVFGAEGRGKNFAYQVWRAYRQGKLLRVPSDQISNPTFAGDIGVWCLTLVEEKACGVWNLASPLAAWSRIRWAEELINALAKVGIRRHRRFRLEPVPTALLAQIAPRPLHTSMLTGKLAGLNLPATEFPRAVALMVEQDRLWYPNSRQNDSV